MTTATLTHNIASEIRAEMARQRTSQTAVAKRLGYSQAKFSRQLNDGRLMTVEFVEAVADALDVPVESLLASSLTPISYDAAMLEAA